MPGNVLKCQRTQRSDRGGSLQQNCNAESVILMVNKYTLFQVTWKCMPGINQVYIVIKHRFLGISRHLCGVKLYTRGCSPGLQT